MHPYIVFILSWMTFSLFPASLGATPLSPSSLSLHPVAHRPTTFFGPIYVTRARLKLHREQSVNSLVILEIPKGAQVKVLDSQFGQWWRIDYRGNSGYVTSNYLKYSSVNNDLDYDPVVSLTNPYRSKPSQTLAYNMALYEHPKANAAILTKLPKGTEVKVIDDNLPGWQLVHFQGRTGYLKEDQLVARGAPVTIQQPPADHYRLTGATSLRLSPTSKSRVMLRFSTGDRVTVLDKDGEWWWKVRFQGKQGWVKRRLLRKE